MNTPRPCPDCAGPLDSNCPAFVAADNALLIGAVGVARERALALRTMHLEAMVTEDYCFICSRATDHRGEH